MKNLNKWGPDKWGSTVYVYVYICSFEEEKEKKIDEYFEQKNMNTLKVITCCCMSLYFVVCPVTLLYVPLLW